MAALPGSDKYRLAVVHGEGSVQYSGFSVLIFNNHRTVRPAFNLNLNSVLFASAAVGESLTEDWQKFPNTAETSGN